MPQTSSESVRAAYPDTAVVIVAAGSGQRLGHGIPKALVPVRGSSILRWALQGVQAAGIWAQTVVAIPEDSAELKAVIELFARENPELRLSAVPGGQTRAESVARALAALGGVDYVLVHDAARPFVPAEVFQSVTRALHHGAEAVIPAVEVVDTIKSVSSCPEGESVSANVPRESLRAVQTPQGFKVRALSAAHRAATASGADPALLTDDAMIIAAQGTRVRVVAGSPYSLKITTPVDLLLAEALVSSGQLENTQSGAVPAASTSSEGATTA